MQPLNNVEHHSVKINLDESHQEKMRIDNSAMLIKSINQSVEVPIHDISLTNATTANVGGCNEISSLDECSNGCLDEFRNKLTILRNCLLTPAEIDKKETLIKIRVLWDYYHWNSNKGSFVFRVDNHTLPQWKINQWHFCFQHGGLPLLRGSDNLSQSTSLNCLQMLNIFNALKDNHHTNLDKLAKLNNKKREILYKFVEKCGYIYSKKNHQWQLINPQISSNPNIPLSSVPIPQLMQSISSIDEEKVIIQTPSYLHAITQHCNQNCSKPTKELLNQLYTAIHFPAKTETPENQQKFAILYNYYQTQENKACFIIDDLDEDASKKIIEDWNFCFIHGGLALLRGCQYLNESALINKENMLYIYLSMMQETDINMHNLSRETHHSVATLRSFLNRCGFFYFKNLFKNQKCWQLTEPKNENNSLPNEPASITLTWNDEFFQPVEESIIQPIQLPTVSDSDLMAPEKKSNNLSQEEKELYSFILQSNFNDLWDNELELAESNQPEEENVELNEDLMESLLPELQAEEILSDLIDSTFDIGSQFTVALNNDTKKTTQIIQDLPITSFTVIGDNIPSTDLSVTTQSTEANTIKPLDENFWLQFEKPLKPIRFREALIQFTTSDWSIDKKLEAKVEDKKADYVTQFVNKTKKNFQLKFKLHALTLITEALALIELENELNLNIGNLSLVEKLTLNINKLNSRIKSIFNNAYDQTFQNYLISRDKEDIISGVDIEHQKSELAKIRRSTSDIQSKIHKIKIEHIKTIEKIKTIQIKLEQIAKEHSFSLRDKNDIIYFHLMFDLESISDDEIKLINMIIVRMKNNLSFFDMTKYVEPQDKINPYHFYFQQFHLSYNKYQIEYNNLMLSTFNLMKAEKESQQSENEISKEKTLQEKRRELNKSLFNFAKISIENDTYLNILGTEQEDLLPAKKTLQILKNELTFAILEQTKNHKILNEKITKLEKIISEHNITKDEIIKYAELYLKETDYLALIQAISAKQRQQQTYIQTDSNRKMSNDAMNRTFAHSHLLEQKAIYLETIKHQITKFRTAPTKESLTANGVKNLKRSASETINAVPAQKICFYTNPSE